MDVDRLMHAIHGRDPRAFRELYEAYASDLRYGVRRFIRKIPRLAPHEDDIVGRAWIRLMARQRKLLRSFDPSKGTFTYFMRMVGANTAWQVGELKSHASKWTRPTDTEQVTTRSADDDLEDLIGHRELLEKLDLRFRQMFTERERFIFTEVFICKRSATDIAASLKVTPEVIWSATSRLRKKLAKIVEELEAELTAPHAPRSLRPTAVMLYLMLSSTGVIDAAHGEHGSVLSTRGSQ